MFRQPKLSFPLAVILLSSSLCLTDLIERIEATTSDVQQNEPPPPLWQHSLLNVSDSVFRSSFLPTFVDFEADMVEGNTSVSPQCSSALRQGLRDLHERRLSAVRLFNSWGRLPGSGLTRGTLVDYGDYDQCVKTDGDDDYRDKNEEGSTGDAGRAYCLVDASVPLPIPISPGHNLHHSIERVLLPAVSAVEPQSSSQTTSTTSTTSRAQSALYEHLAEHAPILYYSHLQVGTCFPAQCTLEDARAIMQSAVARQGLELKKVTCNTDEHYMHFNLVQWCSLLFLTLMVLLQVAGCLYDHLYYCSSDRETIKFDALLASSPCSQSRSNVGQCEWLLWFSPLRNLRKVFECEDRTHGGGDSDPSEAGELASVHGLRVVTMVLIVAGHALDWNVINSFRDSFTIRDRLTELATQFYYRLILTVDSFFFLSGLLTSYMTLRHTGGHYRNFSSVAYLVLRYLRLTPQLVGFLAVTFVLPSLYDGPLWRRYIGNHVDQCYRNWWLDFVYLQNLVQVQAICGLHTWYLAADMQLHWIALVPLILWLRNRCQGRALILAMVGVCVAWSSFRLYRGQMPPGSVSTAKNDILTDTGMPTDFLRFIYRPVNHVSVFFIGFLLGDRMASHRLAITTMQNGNNAKPMQSSPTPQALWLWLVALGSFLFSIYSVYPWVRGRPYDPFWSAVLFPFNLLSWSAGMALVVWLSSQPGSSGPVGRLLSHRLFRPLSRVTYSVYLSHVWLVWVTVGGRRHLIDLSTHSLTLFFTSLLVLAFAIGLVFTLLFDSPVIAALAHARRSLRRKSPKPSVFKGPTTTTTTTAGGGGGGDNTPTPSMPLNVSEFEGTVEQLPKVVRELYDLP